MALVSMWQRSAEPVAAHCAHVYSGEIGASRLTAAAVTYSPNLGLIM